MRASLCAQPVALAASVMVLLRAPLAGAGADQEALTILHAGSLSVPFDRISKAFTAKHRNVTVQREAAGSRASARKVTELGKQADLVASADYLVIEELMMPRFSDWHVIFTTNEMVLAFSRHSRHADSINQNNWYDVLLRPDVEYGHSDPNADPCGYRSRMVMQLAERFYGKPGLGRRLVEGVPAKNIRPKETDLIALVEAGELDYIFQYRSVAVQHNLRFVALPEEINLSNIDKSDLYEKSVVQVVGDKPGKMVSYRGTPIAYSVTIPSNAPHPELAVEFLGYLLGPEGRRVLEELGQPAITPVFRGNLASKQVRELQERIAGVALDSTRL